MVACWVVLCKIVGKVGGSFIPVDAEVILLNAVLDPEAAHVHRFGALGLEGVVRDTVCSTIRLLRSAGP